VRVARETYALFTSLCRRHSKLKKGKPRGFPFFQFFLRVFFLKYFFKILFSKNHFQDSIFRAHFQSGVFRTLFFGCLVVMLAVLALLDAAVMPVMAVMRRSGT
jgi:hypothetical protein